MLRKIKGFLKWKLRGEVPTNHLVKLGLSVGTNFRRQDGCDIDPSHCWLIKIGNNVALAPGVRLIAHDASTLRYMHYTKIGLIEIGDNVFIGAGSIILPGVKIGNDVIVGAGSVVSKDVPDGHVVAGNPARKICLTSEYIDKYRELMNFRPCYDKSWTTKGGITSSQKEQMKQNLKAGIGFVV